MRHELLTTEVVPGDGWVTLRLAGEIDMSNAASVRDAAICALRQHATTLHLDLSRVTFMDSTGVEVILSTRRRAELEGGQLLLIEPTHAVLRILQVTGVDRLFRIEPGTPTSEGARERR